jgi:predicted metalloenzyme YecM
MTTINLELSPEQIDKIAFRVHQYIEQTRQTEQDLRLLTVYEVAELMKCEHKKVYRLRQQYPEYWVKFGREWRISPTNYRRLIATD